MATPYTPPPSQGDLRNLILAVALCTGLLFMWQVLYQNPQQETRRALQAELDRQRGEGDVVLPHASSADATTIAETRAGVDELAGLSRRQLLERAPRVKISSPAVHGSINLKGLRFDDLTLARHKVSLEKDSPEVVLLSPAEYRQRYFVQLGWLAAPGQDVTVPDADSEWTADHSVLTPSQPVTFTWKNPQGVDFLVKVAVDEDYLFTVTQQVVNHSGATVAVMPYGLVNLARPEDAEFAAILHHGPLGVLDGATLTEVSYDELFDEGVKRFEGAKGWLGIADKYWLTAIIPQPDERFTANFQPHLRDGKQRAQADYLAPPQVIRAGQSESYSLHVFAGAKELGVLEQYREAFDIPLFDRALDFGVLYFITKPIFLTLDFLYGLLGNFGLAILVFVILLKIVLFPLSNKSYRSMAKMRTLQPEIDRIRKQHENDKLKMQQEIMGLWQKEKVNPVSGCLPMLIQLPIFFALYKVLLVTIEMRHAPFYGWIDDLSAKDPTNVFTLFGLVPWDPPGILHLGLWPIIMAATMLAQQKLNPKPTDPIQAKVIGFLPYLFLILFAAFPAGLLIYWAWNNVLSIAQQWWIMHSYEKGQAKKAKKAVAAAE